MPSFVASETDITSFYVIFDFGYKLDSVMNRASKNCLLRVSILYIVSVDLLDHPPYIVFHDDLFAPVLAEENVTEGSAGTK